MRDFIDRIEELWCTQMHSNVMWPMHGKYRCGTCHREYAVEFEIIEQPAGVRRDAPEPRFRGFIGRIAPNTRVG